ncbi:hypothetical protein EP47_02235 [Legionella norrlandica]|uniref:DUF2845 domain-containing protein n=1 Tax=Legionella norrlandica TaxID=1498499 RepID=A0A0A2T7M7_9GAMM|nr:DUF2845 domain-containing protein [Legionella norrlandica]KGP63388.1 hypothetical protein EP47_02235 [Legionella norrlandica]
MKSTLFTSLALLLVPFSLMGDQSLYCPQNHAYINVGMSMDQVIAACGEPLSKQDSNQPLLQKIPVQQLIYNNLGSTDGLYSGSLNVPTGTAFYGVWNIPTGSSGIQLEVDILNNKVQALKVNGGDTNAFSLCGDTSIQVGDPASKVYGACGSPNLVNNTYINQPVPTATKPQIWVYQPGPYQPAFSLTFVDGKLQSIGNN